MGFREMKATRIPNSFQHIWRFIAVVEKDHPAIFEACFGVFHPKHYLRGVRGHAACNVYQNGVFAFPVFAGKDFVFVGFSQSKRIKESGVFEVAGDSF
jgi:hypothetical protein